MGGLERKVALVTGAGGGIGCATAIAFAEAGACLVLSDVDAEAGARTLARLRDKGVDAPFIQADVTKEAEVAALVSRIVEIHGRLDIAFNNAGIEEENARLADGDETLFDRIFAINVKGVWLCMKHELRRMVEQGGGAIVNTASIAGLVGAPFLSAYSASKHAVVGLTKSAAVEYAKHGIRINSVCPGVIRTPMYERAVERNREQAGKAARLHPLGRIGESEEVANAVLWLASDAASFVTGHQLVIDGGFTAI